MRACHVPGLRRAPGGQGLCSRVNRSMAYRPGSRTGRRRFRRTFRQDRHVIHSLRACQIAEPLKPDVVRALTNLRACPHCPMCAGTRRCRCLHGGASLSASSLSPLRRCRRVPGSARTPTERRRGPWPVLSEPETSPSASGRCSPSVTAHQSEDGSRRPPSLTPGTWPPPSPPGDHALGSVVSGSSPLRPAAPWRAAGSPAG